MSLFRRQTGALAEVQNCGKWRYVVCCYHPPTRLFVQRMVFCVQIWLQYVQCYRCLQPANVLDRIALIRLKAGSAVVDII